MLIPVGCVWLVVFFFASTTGWAGMTKAMPEKKAAGCATLVTGLLLVCALVSNWIGPY